MMTPNDSLTMTFEELLNSAPNESFSGTLVKYLDPNHSQTPSPLSADTSKMNEDSEFHSQTFEWVSTGNEHECCKCVKESIIPVKDTMNGITPVNSFHFCGWDQQVKCCSTTKIDTYISSFTKTKRSCGGKATKRKLKNNQIKINLDIWKSAKLEICLQDIYCTDLVFKYIEPKLRYERGIMVWVKMLGYPTWPAMVDDDPDHETHYRLKQKTPQIVQYHVVFFDEEPYVSRCWSTEDRLNMFTFKPFINFKSTVMFRRFQAGLQQAKKAAAMSVEERLAKYGFAARMREPNIILVEN